ncbi:MAG: alanine--glyoxylate aminotransferase family protein [Candidatus Limnocylindrales bacterium]
MPPQHLRIPGPTPLPAAVREAGSEQMVGHRTEDFMELVARCSGGMQPYFETTSDVMILTSSGSGGLEAAVVSFLSPGDPVLTVSIGNFGERFGKIALAYGADATVLRFEWGQAADPDAVREAIREMVAAGRSPKAVQVTYNETSTGVTNPLPLLAEAIRSEVPDTLILVDGVSAVGAVPMEMDAWDLDVVVTGSQKAWMIPPGLAMVAASDRAWAAAETATMPRFYFDLVPHRDAIPKGQTPWTPAVGLFFQLAAALDIMAAEGRENIYARHAAAGAAARAGLAAMGFDLYADPAHASNTVTSALVPDGVEWSALNEQLRAGGLQLAGGQGQMKGKLLRIGHLGDVTVDDIVAAIEIIEQGALAIGRTVEPGVGPAAARQAGGEMAW